MIRLLLPVMLALLGLGAGVGAGVALRPDNGESADAAPRPEAAPDQAAETPKPRPAAPDKKRDYVKLNNQFIVPVIGEERVQSLVILSLSLEIEEGQRQMVYDREPKLRDVLLQVMFDHANMGGFDGAFTDANTLDVLRQALTEAAQRVIGRQVSEVLITNIARQDV